MSARNTIPVVSWMIKSCPEGLFQMTLKSFFSSVGKSLGMSGVWGAAIVYVGARMCFENDPINLDIRSRDRRNVVRSLVGAVSVITATWVSVPVVSGPLAIFGGYLLGKAVFSSIVGLWGLGDPPQPDGVVSTT